MYNRALMSLGNLARYAVCLFTVSVAPASDLPVRAYSTADGLRNNSVNRIVADSQGYLWFCTSDGVSRFDGYGFRNFGVGDGLGHRRVNDILESRSGDFWIGTGGGLCLLGRGASSAPAVRGAEAPPGTRWISRLLEPRSSSSTWPVIWCGTDSGLFRYTPRNREFQRVPLGPTAQELSAFIYDLYEDGEGSVWVGSDQGLYRYREGLPADRYTVQQGLPANQVTSIRQDGTGAIRVATWRGAARVTRRGVDPWLNRRNGLAGDYLYSLLSLKNGEWWLAGTGGVTVTDARGVVQRQITGADGLVVDDAEALAEDPSGNVWVGTDGGGAVKIARSGFTTYSARDGIEGRPSAIFESQAGELMLATKSESRMHFYRRQGERFQWERTVSSRQNFGWGTGQVAFQGRQGDWWIASAAGLYRSGASTAAARLESLSFGVVRTGPAESPGPFKAFEDSRGDVWMAFRRAGRLGLGRWCRRQGSIEYITTADESAAPSSFPFVFAEDRAGAVWVGYFQGTLMRFRRGRFEPVALPVRATNGIRSLLSDSKGRLWIGTSEAGLLRIDQPEAEQPKPAPFAGQENFSGDFIQCLAEDSFGRIYACTGRGVEGLDPVSGRSRRYTAEDGLVKGDLQLALRDREGAVWFGSPQGVSRLIPQAGGQAGAPYVQINRLDVGGVPQAISPLGQNRVTGLTIPFGRAPVRIEAGGVTFRPGDVLRYQTKLEPADSDWSAPSPDRSFSYVALPPGSYRFLARAVNADGLTTAVPAEVDLTVLAPFWRRGWFLWLAALAATLTAFSAHRVRMARVLEVERVRNRIATDLHDDIGSTLSQISVLSEVARREAGAAAHAPIARISELSSQVLDSMSDIVWAINPARDRIGDLIQRMRHFAAELFTAADIELDFLVDAATGNQSFHPELRRELLLVFKEAANNVVKHARAKRVTVRVWAGRDGFAFAVSDDGAGFDRARLSGEGQGLASMERRVRRLGGTAAILSTPGAGTTVRVEVPARRRRGPT